MRRVKQFLVGLGLTSVVAASLIGLSTRTVSADVLANGSFMYYGSCVYSDGGAYSFCLKVLTGYDNISPPVIGLELSVNNCNYPPACHWTTLNDGDTHHSGYGTHFDACRVCTTGYSGYGWMQSDGNFVLYNENGSPNWYTSTAGYGSSAFLQVQSDTNVVVYYNGSTPIWSIV